MIDKVHCLVRYTNLVTLFTACRRNRIVILRNVLLTMEIIDSEE